ncbi:hypothetical protein D9M68_19110 [compost metagenome]
MQVIIAVNKVKANEIIAHYDTQTGRDLKPLWNFIRTSAEVIDVIREAFGQRGETVPRLVNGLIEDNVTSLVNTGNVFLTDVILVQLSVDTYMSLRDIAGPTGVISFNPNPVETLA